MGCAFRAALFPGPGEQTLTVLAKQQGTMPVAEGDDRQQHEFYRQGQSESFGGGVEDGTDGKQVLQHEVDYTYHHRVKAHDNHRTRGDHHNWF